MPTEDRALKAPAVEIPAIMFSKSSKEVGERAWPSDGGRRQGVEREALTQCPPSAVSPPFRRGRGRAEAEAPRRRRRAAETENDATIFGEEGKVGLRREPLCYMTPETAKKRA